MSDAVLLYKAALASEVPRLFKHVSCNPLNCMCKLVRRTSSRSKPIMCSEVAGGNKLNAELLWCITVFLSSEADLIPSQ